MHAQARWSLAALIAVLLGCRSLSIEPDLRRAAEHLEPRLGFGPEWSEAETAQKGALRLTLEDAVRLAVERHPRIRVELAELAARRADLVEAGLLPNPVVSLAFGIPVDGGGGSPGRYNVMQAVAALWKRPARVASAEADLRAAVLRLADATVELAAGVGGSMAAVHHARRRLALSSRRVAILEERVALVRRREVAGEATRIETNSARVDLAAARQAQVNDRERVETAERGLLERLGLGGRPTDNLALDFSTLPAIETRAPSEEALLDLVATQRLDVVAAFAAAGGAEARTRVASLDRWPDLDAGAEYERNFEHRDSLAPMLRIAPPIFDTGRAALARAAAIEKRNRAEADGILQRAILETRLAHVAWNRARERWSRLGQDLLAPRRESHRLAAQAATAGEATRIEELREEALLVDAERRHEDAALGVRRAWFELLRAAGGSLDPLAPAAEEDPR